MIEIPEHIKVLIEKHLSGSESPADKVILQEWRNLHPDHEEEFVQMMHLWHAAGAALARPEFDASRAWQAMEHRLSLKERKTGLFVRMSLPARIAIAVVVIGAAVLIGGRIFSGRVSMTAGWRSVVAESENKKIALPDGSTVSLRKGAALRYPAVFDGPERRVMLTGDAFFDIYPAKDQPFRIGTARSVIEVLGTSFLVKSSPSLDRVIVRTGRVLVTDKDESGRSCILSEKQQAVLSEKGLEQRPVTAGNYLSWQTGDLTFEETPLNQVVEDLSDHYGVEVRLADGLIPKAGVYKITAQFRRQPLEQPLEEIIALTGLRYQKNGDTIIIYQP